MTPRLTGERRAARWLRWPKTLRLVWSIARQSPPPWLRWMGQPCTIESREFATRHGPIRGVVYRPRRVYATVVANGGFVRESVDDPRLRNFAGALAESGFLVITPDYPDVRTLTFTARTIDHIQDVFDAVRTSPDLGGERPLAAIGLSYMATLSLKAALRKGSTSPPDYLGVFGGYDDFLNLMQDVFLDAYRFGAVSIPVDPYGRFLLLRSVVDYFDPPPAEREAIRELAYRCGKGDPDEQLGAEVHRLSPAGRRAFEALRTFEPTRAPELWETILRDYHGQAEALSVSEPAGCLRSRLMLFHSYYDHVLPYAHSVRLHERFPQSTLVLTALFTHVNVRMSPGVLWSRWGDVRRVVGVFASLMALQE